MPRFEVRVYSEHVRTFTVDVPTAQEALRVVMDVEENNEQAVLNDARVTNFSGPEFVGNDFLVLDEQGNEIAVED